MTPDKQNDNSKDNCETGLPRPKLDTPDAHQARSATGEQVDAIKAANPNASDGSLRMYKPANLAGKGLAGRAQELSFEIDMGGGTITSRDSQSLIAKGPGENKLPTDATNASAHKSETSPLRLEKHSDKPYEVQKKPPAPGGQGISLSDFFLKYSSPFADAYNRSKSLKPGEQGKSPTLESIVDRMFAVPWSDKLMIKIDPNAKNSAYHNEDNTLIVFPNSDPTKYLQNAGHEAYHSSHQYLVQLYGTSKPSKEKFVEIKVNSEVDAFLQEIKIRQELGEKNSKPVSFNVNHWPYPDENVNLEELVHKGGRKALFDFLKDANPGFFEPSYSQHFSESYENFAKAYNDNQPEAAKLIKKWQVAGNDPLDL